MKRIIVSAAVAVVTAVPVAAAVVSVVQDHAEVPTYSARIDWD